MDFNKIPKLITEDEDEELFLCQQKIIEDSHLEETDKLIRLAILQCITPIEDWENAAEILRQYCTNLMGRNLLFAAYIAVTAFQMVRYSHIEYFLSLLNQQKKNMDADFCSIAEYLEAEYILEESYDRNKTLDIETAKSLLERSIFHSTKYVMNYWRLSEFCDGEYKKELIQKALANVKVISLSRFVDADELPFDKIIKDPMQLSLEEIVSPDAFFEEMIIRSDIDVTLYQQLMDVIK